MVVRWKARCFPLTLAFEGFVDPVDTPDGWDTLRRLETAWLVCAGRFAFAPIADRYMRGAREIVALNTVMIQKGKLSTTVDADRTNHDHDLQY